MKSSTAIFAIVAILSLGAGVLYASTSNDNNVAAELAQVAALETRIAALESIATETIVLPSQTPLPFPTATSVPPPEPTSIPASVVAGLPQSTARAWAELKAHLYSVGLGANMSPSDMVIGGEAGLWSADDTYKGLVVFCGFPEQQADQVLRQRGWKTTVGAPPSLPTRPASEPPSSCSPTPTRFVPVPSLPASDPVADFQRAQEQSEAERRLREIERQQQELRRCLDNLTGPYPFPPAFC